jgi:uncharacterized membrane protein YfcA
VRYEIGLFAFPLFLVGAILGSLLNRVMDLLMVIIFQIFMMSWIFRYLYKQICRLKEIQEAENCLRGRTTSNLRRHSFIRPENREH